MPTPALPQLKESSLTWRDISHALVGIARPVGRSGASGPPGDGQAGVPLKGSCVAGQKADPKFE